MKTHEQDEKFMELALEQARQALRLDEVPVGAVIVRNGQVIASGYNLREANQDPSAHAEMIAIRAAAHRLGSWRLEETRLYVTLEPCAMCAGAVIQARIPELIFGAHDPKAGAVGSLYNLLQDERFNHQVKVRSGVLKQDCSQLLRDFFQELRIQKDS